MGWILHCAVNTVLDASAREPVPPVCLDPSRLSAVSPQRLGIFSGAIVHVDLQRGSRRRQPAQSSLAHSAEEGRESHCCCKMAEALSVAHEITEKGAV